ncbi:hypothetical protein ABE427_01960 [Acinetobacter higginsii]|uniref:hypothetical protein n=1 Tax=Acinetobacter higginsii TaxID=70347 RepID=UPI0032080C21
MSKVSEYDLLMDYEKYLNEDILKLKIDPCEIANKVINIELNCNDFLKLIEKISPPFIFYKSNSLDELIEKMQLPISLDDLYEGSLLNYITTHRKTETEENPQLRRTYQIFYNSDFSLKEKPRSLQLFIPFNGNYLTNGEFAESWVGALNQFDLISYFSKDYHEFNRER